MDPSAHCYGVLSLGCTLSQGHSVSFLPGEDIARKWPSAAQEEDLCQIPSLLTLLSSQPLRLWKKDSFVHKPPSLCYLVNTVQKVWANIPIMSHISWSTWSWQCVSSFQKVHVKMILKDGVHFPWAYFRESSYRQRLLGMSECLLSLKLLSSVKCGWGRWFRTFPKAQKSLLGAYGHTVAK